VTGPVVVVTIDRPHARNAVDRPTAEALVRAFSDFDADGSQLVAVLTGAGGTFCAVAGGLELALWCDLRVASESAVFGVFNRRWGVPLVDGGTVRLPRIVGMGRALDMILTGRPVPGREAVEMGLANRIVETGRALEEAVSMAEQIASFPELCMRSDRWSSLEQWELSLEAALSNEFQRGVEVLSSGESTEGAVSFARGEGRHGSFEGA
jgi:enoyl-CoA hydratase